MTAALLHPVESAVDALGKLIIVGYKSSLKRVKPGAAFLGIGLHEEFQELHIERSTLLVINGEVEEIGALHAILAGS